MEELVKQQWLIPFLPLVAAGVQSLLPRSQRKLSAGICLVAMGAACVLALNPHLRLKQWRQYSPNVVERPEDWVSAK